MSQSLSVYAVDSRPGSAGRGSTMILLYTTERCVLTIMIKAAGNLNHPSISLQHQLSSLLTTALSGTAGSLVGTVGSRLERQTPGEA